MKHIKTYEGWKENLAVGLSLMGSVAMGHNKEKTIDKDPQSITKSQETQGQTIERMSKVADDKENKDGYGFGSSSDLSTCKKQALFNAKKNLMGKGINFSNIKEKETHIYNNENGGYECHIIVSTN